MLRKSITLQQKIVDNKSTQECGVKGCIGLNKLLV